MFSCQIEGIVIIILYMLSFENWRISLGYSLVLAGNVQSCDAFKTFKNVEVNPQYCIAHPYGA